MNSISRDLYKADIWLVRNLKKIDRHMDHSLESVKVLEELIDAEIESGEPIEGGFFDNHFGWKVFCFSAYLGEVIIKETNSSRWKLEDADVSDGVINIALESANGAIMWPGHQVLKRIQEGKQFNLYEYAQVSRRKMKHDGEVSAEYRYKPKNYKPWWKFW